VTLDDAFERVTAASLRGDWREMLKWEGRMEEMIEDQPDVACNNILAAFSSAHGHAFNLSGSKDNALSVVRLETRNVEVLGKMQRFRDQGAESLTNSVISARDRSQKRVSSGHGRLQKLTDFSR
jgi:hypothetical protein